MKSEELLEKLLENSNYYEFQSSMNEFTKQYIQKLLLNIILYVDAEIRLGEIRFCDNYHLEHEASQEIVGVPSAYSALDGNAKVLTAFAESYSNLGIAEFDSLCREALLDFLNLNNGLFVVDLSEHNICELSLGVPKQSNDYILSSDIQGKITIIPVTFSYGTINFILLKTA